MYELHLVLTGSLEFVRDRQRYLLKPDDIIMVGPGVRHTALALEPNTVTLVLRFSADALREYKEQSPSFGFQFVSNDLDRDSPRCRHLRFYCAYLLRALAVRDAYLPKRMQAAFELLKITLFTMFDQDGIDTPVPASNIFSSSPIQDVIQYIDDNYARKLSLEGLAEHFKYNRTYISTLFKRRVGIGFYDYLTRTRFAHAVWDLSSTDMSLTKVALYNGFPDLKTFNHLFQDTFHLSPTEYRQRLPSHLTNRSYDDWDFQDPDAPEIKAKLDEYLWL